MSKNVILIGRGPVTLRDDRYLGAGGEGAAYQVGSDTVVKLFKDPYKMLSEDMAGKIDLLSAIKHPWIASPQGIVTDGRNRPIGYYMPLAKGGALPLFFTNDHRQQVGFTDKDASELVERMRQVVQVAHDHQAVMVDANEYGWLVTHTAHDKPEPHVVDVDSWQVGRWKASVIMLSIRDYHTQGFTELSDWFSWAVVTFQLYSGLHPYKGSLDGYARNDFTARMKANASVFAPGVRFNSAVRDFNCIPPKLLGWYERTFQNGERSVAPSPFDTSVAVAPKIQILRATTNQVSGLLVFDRLYQAPPADPIIRVFECGVALLKSLRLVNLETKLKIGEAETADCEVVRVSSGWLIAERINSHIKSWYADTQGKRTDLSLVLAATGFVRFRDRLFVVTERGLTELSLKMFGKPVLTVGQTWQAVMSAVQFFEGCGIQDALGATYLLLPHGDDMLSYTRMRELDGLKVVNARAAEGFVTIIAADNQGSLSKIEITFPRDYESYQIWSTDVDTVELNVVTLPHGVCATTKQDGELVVFVPRNGMVNKFQDKTILVAEKLASWANKVVLIRNGDLWHVSVKK